MNYQTNTIQAKIRYPLLRCAIEDYHCLPQDLSSKQQQQLLAHLTKAQWIEGYVARQSAHPVTSEELLMAEQTLIAQFPSMNDYHQARDWLELDDELLQQSLTQALKADRVLAHVREQVEPPVESELMEFYQQHPEQFVQPEQRVLRHILRTINDDLAENTLEQVWPWMYTLAAQLRADPTQFADAAMRHSECPSALQGGVLGRVQKGQLYPELEAVAFELTDNQVSDPVESPMGVHLLWCESHQDAQQLSFAAIQSALYGQMLTARQKQAERAYMAKVIGAKLPS
ncbi:nitrogen fixation protein NifM [Celerinatantimonas yamalensis]|uniref:peptidylprolyl isomerase n=1 Tax=Celerinatantimonas yamalensis TaxID=559956 RepID=A0ABW9G4K8_9GAMM